MKYLKSIYAVISASANFNTITMNHIFGMSVFDFYMLLSTYLDMKQKERYAINSIKNG